MNFSRLFYSFFLALIALFFILLGMSSVLIAASSAIRTRITAFFLDHPAPLLLFGIVSILVGIATLVNILLSAKHRYYVVRAGESPISVDEIVIQQYLDKYFAALFPQCEIPSKVFLKDNRIHLFANFPHLSVEEQKSLLERIEDDLTKGFQQLLDYRKEFYISASFRESP